MNTHITQRLLSGVSALLAASFLVVAPAQAAKLKSIKYHFIQSGSYTNTPAMEMKFIEGQWQWVNKKSAHVPAKIKLKGYTENINLYAFDHQGHKKEVVFSKTAGLNNFEDVVTAKFKPSYFKKNLVQAKNLCSVFGGKKKVVRDMSVKTLLQAYKNKDNGKNTGYKYGKMNVKVICHPKVVPGSSNTGAFALKIKDLKLSTIPAKPRCGQPFKLVANLKTNLPKKVSLKLLRNNGMEQNFSIQPKKGNGGHSGIWTKNYNLKSTEKRAYKVIVKGKAVQTPWHIIHVKCVGGNPNGLQK